jgi:hypothetical protein
MGGLSDSALLLLAISANAVCFATDLNLRPCPQTAH